MKTVKCIALYIAAYVTGALAVVGALALTGYADDFAHDCLNVGALIFTAVVTILSAVLSVVLMDAAEDAEV